MRYLQKFDDLKAIVLFKKHLDSDGSSESYMVLGPKGILKIVGSGIKDPIILDEEHTDNEEAILKAFKDNRLLGDKYDYEYDVTLSKNDLANITTLGQSMCSIIENRSMKSNENSKNITDLSILQYTNLTNIAGFEDKTLYNMFGMYYLEKVRLPKTITAIGHSAFAFCLSLKDIIIPNSVTEIKTKAFFNCINLKSITIPINVTRIEDNAFNKCENLTKIIFKSTVPPTILKNTFNGISDNVQIIVPEDALEEYKEKWPTITDKISC